MAKTKISEFSSTPGNNTDIDSINIAEGCAPSGINDAIRELMAQLKDFQQGTAGDSFNGPVGTTTAAAGAFTTLSASGAVTLSGGTANGVPYLNGSKVLTTGSALTFDGSLLNTAGSIRAQTSLFVYGTGDRLNVFPQAAGSGVQLLVTNNANSDYAPLSFDGSRHVFNLFGGEQMRLTSTGLGIGTSSPGARLSIGDTSTTTSNQIRLHGPASGTAGGASINVVNGTDTIFAAGNASNIIGGSYSSDGMIFWGNAALRFYGNSAERMRLDSSGNLGLGVTPSGWVTKAMQIGGFGSVSGDSNTITLGHGFYGTPYTGFGTYYATTGEPVGAFRVAKTSTPFIWQIAGAGTAGNAISWTQAMTLDASGNRQLGTTSSLGSARDTIQFQSSSGGTGISLNDAQANNTAKFIGFYSNGTGIGSITNNGNAAVLYNVTSDQRLKENIVDAPEFGGVIDCIKVRSYDWKADGNHQRAGFIAQELVTVAPEAVHQPADPEEMMAVDYSKLVPMLVKEIQSLRKRLAALESN